MDDSREDIEQARAKLQRRLGAAEGWDDSCEAAAGEFVKLMVKAGIGQREIIRRVCTAGVSREGALELLDAAMTAKSGDEKNAEEADLAGATPICPHCLTPVGQLDHFCPKCAGPITAIASMDPMGHIYSTGRAYQRAVTGRPRGIVVLGMWLIFGPSFLGLLYVLCDVGLSCWRQVWYSYTWNYAPDWMDVLGGGLSLLVIIAVLALHSAILGKVTAHWLRAHQQVAEDDQAEASNQ